MLPSDQGDRNGSLVRFWEREIPYQHALPRYSARMAQRLLDGCEPPGGWTGRRVLDLGAGFGEALRHLIGKGASGVALDIVEANARHCAGFAPSVRADVRRIPLRDASFDFVYSLGVVEHFPETLEALREHRRVLKPGGGCLVVVPNLVSPYAASFLYHYLRGNSVDLASVGKRYSRSAFRDLALRAGFRRADVRPCYGHAFLRVLPFGYNETAARVLEKLTLSGLFGHWLACVASG